ncbi:MAG: RagB/SusD family nutrient uptake outer membrane protein [Mediterranea massiliensis]|nr:RagB/SusD family nutrient uptake outer membrane protein [Mediterranea massiliensis]
MKSRIKLYLAVGLLTATAGCTDLDVDINSQLTEFPDSEIAAEAKLADIYYSFRGALGRRYSDAVTFSSDEFTGISFDGDYYNSGENSHPTLHMLTPDDVSIGYWPEDLTGGITRCNRAIMDLGGEEEPAAAPALAMRAFYHFILMDSFGDMPILDHLLDDGEAIDRSPRAEVAAFIESDLLKALPNLTKTVDASTYGKPNYWMAQALLAKLYINWAVYTAADVAKYEPTNSNPKLNDCVKICDEIIASGIFNLSDGYREKFWPENGPHIKDFIYAMPYDRITAQGMTYARFRTWRQMNKLDPTMYGFKLSASVGGNFAVNPNVVDLLTLPGDERNLSIVGGPIYFFDGNRNLTNEPVIYNGEQLNFTKEITLKVEGIELNVGKDVNGWSQGYKSVKWFPTYDDYLNGRNQSNDVPIFRYADIVLTKAEAILRGASATGGDTPASLMNEIRAYVGAPDVEGTPTLQDLLDERGREFFDENWRRNDLIRFGMFEEDWGLKHKINPAAKTEKFRRIFPLHTDWLNKNTNWKQNPGY